MMTRIEAIVNRAENLHIHGRQTYVCTPMEPEYISLDSLKEHPAYPGWGIGLIHVSRLLGIYITSSRR